MVGANEQLLASIDDVIAKTGELKAALDSVPDHIETTATLTGEDEILEQVAEIREYLDGIPDHKNVLVTVEQAGGTSASNNLFGGDGFAYTADDVQRLNDLLRDTEEVAAAAGDATEDAGGKAEKALSDASNAARTYHGWWGVLQHDVQLWGGAFDGVDKTLIDHVATWHIVLDGLLEATIAVTGAVIALGYAFVALEPAGQDIYDRLKAIETVSHATGVNIAPLTGKFQSLQQAMAPRAIELYGDALNALNSDDINPLDRAIEGVVNLLDKWGAEIDIWMTKSDGMTGAIQKGTGYLDQLGQLIADIVVAIGNLMKAEPGVAHFVLDFVDGFAKAFDVLTGFSPMLDKVALALHGVMLWGGLLVSIFANIAVSLLKPISALLTFTAGTKAATTAIEEFEVANDVAATPVQKLGLTLGAMGTAFASVGGSIKTWATGVGEDMAEAEGAMATSAAGMKGIMGGLVSVLDVVPPVAWITAMAAGVAYLAYETTQATPAVTKFVSSIQGAVEQMSASQAMFGGIDNAIDQLDQKMASTNVASEIQNWSGSWQHFGDDARATLTNAAEGISNLISGDKISGLEELGTAIKDVFVPGGGAAIQARNDINAYSQAIASLTSQQKTLFQVAGTAMKDNSVSFAQAAWPDGPGRSAGQ